MFLNLQMADTTLTRFISVIDIEDRRSFSCLLSDVARVYLYIYILQTTPTCRSGISRKISKQLTINPILARCRELSCQDNFGRLQSP